MKAIKLYNLFRLINAGLITKFSPAEVSASQKLALKINDLLYTKEKCEHRVGVLALLVLVAIAFQDDETEFSLEYIGNIPEGEPDGSVGWN